jgi:predicted ATP-dependent protease
LSAYRAGLREVIMPKANEKDLRDVPEEVRKNMVFTFVDRMDEVLHLALLPRVSELLADSVQGEMSVGIAGSTTPADREEPMRASSFLPS